MYMDTIITLVQGMKVNLKSQLNKHCVFLTTICKFLTFDTQKIAPAKNAID